MIRSFVFVFTFLCGASLFAQDVTLGVTSPIHQKYQGKIVFTSNDNDITKQKENEAGFKTEFNLGDPIYFRVYLKDALLNTMRPLANVSSSTILTRDSRWILKVYLDGKYLDSLYTAKLPADEFSDNAKTTWTTFRGALKSADNSVYLGTIVFKELLTKYDRLLTSGKHKLKIEVYPSFDPVESAYKQVTGPLMASGEITLTVSGSAIDKNDPSVCMPLAKMSDAELEKHIIASYAKAYNNTALSMKITSAQWEIVNNRYTGLPTKRTLDINVGYKANGKCYKRAYLAIQQYDGRTYLKDIVFESNMQNPEKEINCKCLEN